MGLVNVATESEMGMGTPMGKEGMAGYESYSVCDVYDMCDAGLHIGDVNILT
jgi:hypothetical protein